MIWIKPSGMEVKTNDMPETIKYCESLGWKQKKDKETPKISKKKTSKKSSK